MKPRGPTRRETETRKDKLARTRDERLALVTDKIEKLSFWGDIKNGDLLTKPQRKEAYFKSKGVDTGEVGLGGGSAKKAAQQKEANEGFDKLEAKRTERFFPKDDTVYHLHPVGFVQHMKVICAPTTPPWMDFVYQEFTAFKGIKENQSPLKEKIPEYHNSSTAKGRTYTTAWCASFVSWCFEQGGFKKVNSGSNSFAFDWAYEGNDLAKKKSESLRTPDPNLTGWKEGEKCEAFMGAVIVLTYSHCAIIVGKNTRLNRYVYIGGNQGKGVQEIKYGTVAIGKEYAIMKPKKYIIQSYDLPELDKNEDGSYDTTH